jgi:hypothetical protein
LRCKGIDILEDVLYLDELDPGSGNGSLLRSVKMRCLQTGTEKVISLLLKFHSATVLLEDSVNKQIGREGKTLLMSQDRVQWWAPVNTVMNLRLPIEEGHFLHS